jgi:PAS domain S-box-containing protein
MINKDQTTQELKMELHELQQKCDSLKELFDKFIIDQRETGDLLTQTKENYETYFNAIGEFLFVLDENANIIHTNTTVNDRLGYTCDELLGKSVLMIHPPERREEAGKIVSDMLGGKAASCPVPLMTKSGTQIPVETKVTPGFWDGKPAIFGVTKDISKVRLSEEKFSKLFHINPSACGLSDMDNHTYIDVNEAFYAFFGFEKDEVIGKTPFDLGIFTHEIREEILQKADKNGNVTNVEANLWAKNGDLKFVLLSSENIYIQDRRYRFTVVQDITERKQSEEKIRLKNEELIKINAEKDKFFSIIAHDLRSPFNGFLGLTQIMAEDLPSLTMADIQLFAVDLSKSASNLYRLLNNLLEWSQIQKGLVPFNPVAIRLRFLVDESIVMVVESARAKNIKLIIDIPDGLEVFGDTNMLQTVIRNLFSNAVKFTPHGGKICLSAKVNRDGTVEVSFCDSGIGMNQKLVDNIFRLDGQTNRKGTDGEPSTGLGLMLCKEFIEKHEGKIWVASEESKGSTFFFTIPVPQPSPA